MYQGVNAAGRSLISGNGTLAGWTLSLMKACIQRSSITTTIICLFLLLPPWWLSLCCPPLCPSCRREPSTIMYASSLSFNSFLRQPSSFIDAAWSVTTLAISVAAMPVPSVLALCLMNTVRPVLTRDGLFGGACSNCIWNGKGAKCAYYLGKEGAWDPSDDLVVAFGPYARNLIDVFSKQDSDTLPLHRGEFDHRVELEQGNTALASGYCKKITQYAALEKSSGIETAITRGLLTKDIHPREHEGMQLGIKCHNPLQESSFAEPPTTSKFSLPKCQGEAPTTCSKMSESEKNALRAQGNALRISLECSVTNRHTAMKELIESLASLGERGYNRIVTSQASFIAVIYTAVSQPQPAANNTGYKAEAANLRQWFNRAAEGVTDPTQLNELNILYERLIEAMRIMHYQSNNPGLGGATGASPAASSSNPGVSATPPSTNIPSSVLATWSAEPCSQCSNGTGTFQSCVSAPEYVVNGKGKRNCWIRQQKRSLISLRPVATSNRFIEYHSAGPNFKQELPTVVDPTIPVAAVAPTPARQSTEVTDIDRPLHFIPSYSDISITEIQAPLPSDIIPIGTLTEDNPDPHADDWSQ
ncbi:uncharacterized protein CDV56_105423 [Aspergillus thermomutatus]|uniref:Uncharacterized protein n=1 Tax=Aspergillus thermomutatus TaxID=41047 RepID=A0A397GC99_ASPTH|nr:uncharacterized protein CDV56_105423 [Aspergillus thermomutatus]RHZ47729.1 hypothetical protein CDV56_105423 [Aspergillus thermomutatus]